jgi:succinyl-CoA synthetase alpha subunit
MKWRSLKVLEETADGCAIGFSDGGDIVDFAGVIAATQTGPGAGLDARLNAQKIVTVVNAHSALKDALESAEKSLMQAIAISETVPGCDTRRWVSALHQVRLALARTKEIDALWKKEALEPVLA